MFVCEREMREREEAKRGAQRNFVLKKVVVKVIGKYTFFSLCIKHKLVTNLKDIKSVIFKKEIDKNSSSLNWPPNKLIIFLTSYN